MTTSARKKRFLVCVRNAGCGDLELRKVYERLPDPKAAREGCVRVIDESGEDYLYPASNFVAVSVPPEAEPALVKPPAARASRRPLERSALARRR